MSKRLKPKVLYALQGTGNGHIARASTLIPLFSKKVEVDVLISGTQSELDLGFPIKYKFYGLTFLYDKKGSIDYFKSLRHNNLFRFLKAVFQLPVRDYDLVICDFEPISAWACKMTKTPCLGLSHQASFLSPLAPRPLRKSTLKEHILKYFAPSKDYFGFHFQSYDTNIYPPLIRETIRRLNPKNNGHYVVYLPAYDDDLLITWFKQIGNKQWEIFSKSATSMRQDRNVCVYPISNEKFLESIESCEGVLCSAGFEGPSEALFLKKKLMVIPIKGQYEQECNAAALQKLGVPSIENLNKRSFQLILEWVYSVQHIPLDFPDFAEPLVDDILFTYLAVRPENSHFPFEQKEIVHF